MADSTTGGDTSAIYQLEYITTYGTAPTTIVFNTQLTLTAEYLPALTFPGGTHVGWYTTANFEDDTKVEIGDSISASVVLYAKWNAEGHLINAMDIYALAESIRQLEESTETIAVRDMADRIRAMIVHEITFTIAGTTYTALEGMTWAEWVNSEYNTAGFFQHNEIICISGQAIWSGSTHVWYTDTIISGNAYILGSIAPR